MNNQVEIIEREEENTLQIYAEAAMMKMPVVIGNAYKKIMKLAEEQKIEVTGAPFVRYLEINWNEVNTGNKFAAFNEQPRRKQRGIKNGICFPKRRKRRGIYPK